MESTKGRGGQIDLIDLTVKALQYGLEAGDIIRKIHSSGNLEVVHKGSGVDEFSGKKVADLQTEADRQAERHIIFHLLSDFPSLRVVGEESFETGDGSGMCSQVEPPTVEPSERKPVSPESLPQSFKEKISSLKFLSPAANRLSCWVDPLDGTAEFAAGNLRSVTTLIGIALDGVPVAGVICKPFYDAPDSDAQPEQPALPDLPENFQVLWALVGVGAYAWSGKMEEPHFPISMSKQSGAKRCGVGAETRPEGGGLRAVSTTRTRSHPIIDGAVGRLKPARLIRRGGAGNKFWELAIGESDAYIFPRMGTKKWDTCAGEAVLKSIGGWLTDAIGRPFRYLPDDPSTFPNETGIVASCSPDGFSFHEKVLMPAVMGSVREIIKEDPQSSVAAWPLPPPQVFAFSETNTDPQTGLGEDARDIARLVDGTVIGPGWVEQRLDLSPGSVQAVDAPEKGAVRYRLSEAVRLELELSDGAAAAGAPKSLYYKRIVPRDLPDVRSRTGSRLDETVRSVLVEASFYGGPGRGALSSSSADNAENGGQSESIAKAMMRVAGVGVPDVLFAHTEFVEHFPVDSRYALLMEDLAPSVGFRQQHYFSPDFVNGGGRLDEVVDCLARFHAFFWKGGGPFEACKTVEETRSTVGAQNGRALVWPLGTFWAMRPGGDPKDVRVAIEKYREAWPQLAESVEGLSELPEKIEAVRTDLGKKFADIHEEANTIVHGDFKAANVLLFSGDPAARTGIGNGQKGGTTIKAGGAHLVDFQWTGRGRPSLDLVYFLLSSISPAWLCRGDGSEAVDEEIVEAYHDRLAEHVGRLGGGRDLNGFSKDRCVDEYRVALAEFAVRGVLSGSWLRFGVDFQERRAKLGAAGYNKSEQIGAFMLRRLGQILKKVRFG